MKTRERILSNIRTSLSIGGNFRNPEPRKLKGQDGGGGRVQPPLSRFIKQCEQTQAKIHPVADIHEAAQSIRALIKVKKVKRVVLWDHPLTQSVMAEVDGDQGVEGLIWNPSRFEDQRTDDKGKARLSDTDLGLTAVDFALADTGSLVLMAAAGHDPLVSLLPPIHVALLEEDQILESIDVFLERINESQSLRSRTFNLISGPSRTGDIELTMSLGVHGPKEVHVILLGSNKIR